jgi:hypothetical protein
MFSESIDTVLFHLRSARGLVEDGFCDQVFSGLEVFWWVSQFTAVACLFLY